MSKTGRELSPEEKKLWRRVAASMKTRRPRALEPDDKPPPPRISREAPKEAPKQTAIARAISAKPRKDDPSPQNRAGEKRVRRGKLSIGATLDLHGHTQDSGRAALARFLRAAQVRGETAVIVVTGVGRGGEGVLKRSLPEWLAAREVRPLVSGYAQAHRAHGGAGAFYVFLKRRAATPD